MQNWFDVDQLIISALKEDLLLGDITTDAIFHEEHSSRAVLIAKQKGILAGIEIAKRVFELMDPSVEFVMDKKDGSEIKPGDILARITGNTRALLKSERTALNLLQRLSGIATKTSEFCKQLEGLPVRLVDTRKTTPGLRILEKYAVKTGGGSNHRFSLSDGVLIKDNHIKAAGSIQKAVEISRKNIPHTLKIEVEVETIEQVKEALEAKADIIMLDNMTLDMMREAVGVIQGNALIEASGNVTLDSVRSIAKTGVDIISSGSLTHSAQALDISMRMI